MDYSSEVRRRFGSALSAKLAESSPGLMCGEAQDRALNVWVRFQVQALDGTIRAVRFQVYGCPHTVAAASWAAEWLEGAAVERIGHWDAHDAAAALDVPVEKLGKLLLLEDALRACAQALRARPEATAGKEG